MTFAVSPRLACVISVWFQPPLLVLLPAVTQQVMGQREGKLRASAKHACRGSAEWSGSVAQIAAASRVPAEDRPVLPPPLLWLMASRSEEKPRFTSNQFTPVLFREDTQKPLSIFKCLPSIFYCLQLLKSFPVSTVEILAQVFFFYLLCIIFTCLKITTIDYAAVSVSMRPIDVGGGHHFGERTGWTVREWNVWFWAA